MQSDNELFKGAARTAGIPQIGRQRWRPACIWRAVRRQLGRRRPPRPQSQKPWPSTAAPRPSRPPSGNATRWPLYGAGRREGRSRVGAQPGLRAPCRLGEGLEEVLPGSLCQALLQRHQRADDDVLRAESAAGQRDHGAQLHVLRHDRADAAVRAGARLRRHQPAHAQLRPGRRQTPLDEEHQGRAAGALDRAAGRHGPHLRLGQGKGPDRAGRFLPRPRRVAARAS